MAPSPHEPGRGSLNALAGVSLLTLLLAAPLAAAPAAELSYFLPVDVEYDPEVPKPSDVLGFEVGADPPPASGRRPDEAPQRRPYADFSDDKAVQLISGAIFGVELDLTHPLAFGYRRATLPVFRNTRHFLEPPPDPYATVAAYSDSPLLSGYVSDENLARLSGSPALIAERLERGAVIRLVDDPNFRAFWYGTHKLLLNALFFGGIFDDTTPKL